MPIRFSKFWSPQKPSRQVLERLIRQTSDAGLAEVCETVSSKIERMPLAEARGYVRARGASIVRRYTHRVISKESQTEVVCSEKVTRSAVELMLPKILRQSRVGIPRTLTVRKAA